LNTGKKAENRAKNMKNSVKNDEKRVKMSEKTKKNVNLDAFKGLNMIYQEDQITFDVNKITTGTDPTHGATTTFHDVVIASEMVQPYSDGYALKDRDELQAYAPYVEGRWVTLGSHPDTAIISDRMQVHGRTNNVRYTKSLKDETKRPKRAGVVADITVFNEKAPKNLLEDMKNGVRRDVSIGFFFHKDETPGEFNGAAYDYVQRNMFHDHLAAALERGRCPSPYCGLGADELRGMVADPFAGFANFAECVRKVKEKNPKLSDESAKKICGSLKAKYEDYLPSDTRQNVIAIAKAIIEECDASDFKEKVLSDDKNLKTVIVENMSKQIDEKIKEILKDL